MKPDEVILRVLKSTGINELYRIDRLDLQSSLLPVDLGVAKLPFPGHLAPFLTAVYLGFSVGDLARMIEELDFELDWINDSLPDIVWYQGLSGKPEDSFDHLNFMQKMVSAYYQANACSEGCAEEIGRWMALSNRGMLAGLVIDSPHTYPLQILMDQGEEPEQQWALRGAKAQKAASVIEHVHDISHFPQGSIRSFMERTGALQTDFIRGRFGHNGFWPGMVLGSSLDPVEEGKRFFFYDKQTLTHQTRIDILFAFEPACFPTALSLYNPKDMYDRLFCTALEAGIGDIVQEDAFLAVVLSDLRDGNVFEFEDNHSATRAYAEFPECLAAFRKLLASPETVFERVMRSQIKNCPNGLPLSQFLVWGQLCGPDTPVQVITPQLARKFCTFAIESFQSFRWAPQGVIPDLDALYDEVNGAMRPLMRMLEPFINYPSLAKMGEAAREDLVLWGLDVHKLDVGREAIVSKRLEIDLGL